MAASAKTGSPLVSATQLCKTYGTRVLFDHVSLGLSTGDVVGVVGRNGDGKTTLLSLLTGQVEPDEGRVTRAASASVGVLVQAEPPVPGTTVRDLIVAGQPDHVWASDAESRAVVEHLLAGVDLDARIETLSGGERRRASLVAVILGRHDLVVLDEPTNHLDVQAVRWLAVHLQQAAARGVAILVVSHDRWFLDAVCDHIWEVHDAQVDAYDGGYAAYVLARAERARMAAATQARRRNLLRKELAWLRRGAPARTSKPKFRLDAASQLIEDEPPPRDELALRTLATSRLGKDVLEFQDVGLAWPDTGRAPILDHTDLILGPGDRIGLIGVNGSGKTTVLRLLDGTLSPTSGCVRRGASVRLAHLSQHVAELDDDERVLESVQRLRRQTALATGHDVGTDTLLGDFGFTGDRLITRIGELSGGERRRLQFLRLLLGEPNVLLLDEPTNDLDIDTLTVVEDYLDTWPGTLVIASHDRYFLERVTDVSYALMDGTLKLLPGGVDEYLAWADARADARADGAATASTPGIAARLRTARKQLARIESQLDKARQALATTHAAMAGHAQDYAALLRLQADEQTQTAHLAALEDEWLALATTVEEWSA